MTEPFRREIRSFVVRGGRLTASQQKAMDTMWPLYGLERKSGKPDWQQVFGRRAPLVFEIGFGMGDSLAAMADRDRHLNYIGADVHPPGIGTILKDISERQLTNLRVYQDDAKELLKECFEQDSLDRIQIYFPDPWHKKRHHKRRLIQPDFIQLLREKLKKDGVIHFATDWENYAEHIIAVMEGAPGFENMFGAGNLAENHDRVETKFERRGLRLGHGVWDMCYKKV